jgi:hypothetical protein
VGDVGLVLRLIGLATIVARPAFAQTKSISGADTA